MLDIPFVRRRLAPLLAVLCLFIAAGAAVETKPPPAKNGPTPVPAGVYGFEPELWNQVKREVDRRGLPGQFILTGSATPADDATRHTGAGRFSRIWMRPMSLFETKHSTGEVSLSELFSGNTPQAAESGLTVSNIVDRICIGLRFPFRKLGRT